MERNVWLIEAIIKAIWENAEELAQLFRRPGTLVIHINPQGQEPVKLEVDRLKLS